MKTVPRRMALFMMLLFASIVIFFLTKPLREEENPLSFPQGYSRYSDEVRRLQVKVSSNPNNPKAHYELAVAYNQEQDFLEAIDELEQAIKLGMDTPDVYHELGTAYAGLNYWEEASACYKKAIKLDPYNLSRYLRLSEVYVESGRKDYALETLRIACRKIRVGTEKEGKLFQGEDSSQAKYFEALSVAFGHAGDLKTSLAFAKRLLHVAPNYPGGHAIAGRSYFLLGDIEKAVKHLRQACRLKPDEPGVHYWLGVALVRTSSPSDEEEAIRHFEKAVQLAPNYARAHYQLGHLYRKRRRWKEATGAFIASHYFGYDRNASLRYAAMMAAKAGERKLAAHLRANYYQASGKLRSALKEFLELNRQRQCCPNGYLCVAEVYQQMGQPEKCVQYLKKALKLRPEAAEIYLRLAEAYSELKDNKAKVAALKRVCQLDPKNAEVAYSKLASQAVDDGRFNDAEAYLKKCIEMRPDKADYYFALAQVYFTRFRQGNRLEKAIEALEKACSLKPNQYSFHHLLGIAYTKANRLKEAAAELRKTINLQPGFGDCYLNLARVYSKLGEKEKSKKMFSFYQKYLVFLEQMTNLYSQTSREHKSAEAHYRFGCAFLKAGDHQKAKEEFLITISLNPDHVQAHEKLALIYGALAQPEEQAKELRLLAKLRAKQEKNRHR